MRTQFSLAKKIGLSVSLVLLAALVLSLGILYKKETEHLRVMTHDKVERVLLALQSSHTQAMLNRGDVKDNNPVLMAFNGTLDTLKESQKNMKIWLFMSDKVIAHQKKMNLDEIEPPLDQVDKLAASTLKKQGRFITDNVYRLSIPIILGEGVATHPKCFSCHQDAMGIKKGELIGGMSVAYDASKDQQEFDRLFKQSSVWVVLLVAGVSSLVFLTIHFFVGKPVQALNHQMQKLSLSDQLLTIPEPSTAASLEEAQILESLHKIFDVSESNVFNFRHALDEHNIVSIADLAGNIVFTNDKFCEISGYTKEELLGKNHRILNSGEHPPEFFVEMWEYITNGKIWKGDIKNKAKDGSYYWVNSTIIPFVDESGKPYEYISIRTDITHIKEKEQELVRLSHEAQAANAAKSQFLATMSHEIRTPMNGVLGMAQLLESTPLNDEQKDYLSTITSSGKSLLNIINDILDFSKLDAHKVELEQIAFDLERVCQECLSLVSGNIQGKPVELIFDFDPQCPRFFQGDPARIKQIMLNLLSNAIKFTSEGYVRCGVACQQQDSQYQLEIQVEDTGIGLKPEAIEHLFDEFTQADSTTTRQYGGTGLGLSICKKLTDIMGGEILVESVFGHGTTFTVKLALPIAEKPKPITAQSLQGVRLLYVDDNKVNQRVFKRQMEHMGLAVDLLDNPNQAIATLHAAIEQETPYQIIVIDHNMPLMSGLELGQLIQKDERLVDLKTLIFSSAGAKGDAALFSQAGFDAYLNKLSRYETLQAILSAMLSHTKGDGIITQHSIADAKALEPSQTVTFEGDILLVEDVPANQVVAKKMLQNMGLRVEIAVNGEQAIEAFQQKSYDLIFMDCRMPVMDGYEATKAIRTIEQVNDRQRTPIIALTANQGSEDKAACINAGMDDLLSKPFNKQQLVQFLKHYIENKQEADITHIESQLDPQLTAFDTAVFNSLKNDVGEEIDEIVSVSLQSLEEHINALRAITPEDDAQEAIRLAHSIKSPAGFIGAKQLAFLAEQLENNLRQQKEIDLSVAFEQIQQAFEQLKETLEQIK